MSRVNYGGCVYYLVEYLSQAHKITNIRCALVVLSNSLVFLYMFRVRYYDNLFTKIRQRKQYDQISVSNHLTYEITLNLKGYSNPEEKYILSKRAL